MEKRFEGSEALVYIKSCADDDVKIRNTVFEKTDCAYEEIFSADFDGCEFLSCIMNDFEIEKCYFLGVQFSGCDFSNTRFSDCCFRGCSFRNCRLTGSIFDDSIVENGSFSDCIMNYSSFSKTRIAADFSGTVFEAAVFLGCKIHRMSLEQCTFERTQFLHTALKGVDFTKSRLESVIVSDSFSELRGAYFTPSQAAQLALLMGIKIK